jgi:hypothetical protein
LEYKNGHYWSPEPKVRDQKCPPELEIEKGRRFSKSA